ncbi:MAG TPA: hypothetical protein PL023_09715 [Thiobacillus sp.]|nr:hypothetical protein [Thiobacillus sp.]
MNKPPRMSNTPVPAIHAYESREDCIARTLHARDQAQATHTYLSQEEVLNRLDQSLALGKNKPPSADRALACQPNRQRAHSIA